eukprot:gene8801-11883_t
MRFLFLLFLFSIKAYPFIIRLNSQFRFSHLTANFCKNTNRISVKQGADTFDNSTSIRTDIITTSTTYDVNQHHAELYKQLQEFAEPFKDINLLNRTIEEWSKPLPLEYMKRPLIVVGPSGVGKNRLIKSLLKDYTRFFHKLVTYTTRNPRIGEINGTNYHFITNESYFTLVNKNFFLEHAQVHNNYYGVSWESWNKCYTVLNKIAIFEVDIQGATSLFHKKETIGIHPIFMFVEPPSIDRLNERLRVRGTENNEEIELRMYNANVEIMAAKQSSFFHAFLLNDDFSTSVNRLFRLVRDW